jgi:glycosyltransferase involved in cell wall biosynthesis
MIVANAVRSDPRVCREAECLAQEGYDVRIFGIAQPSTAPPRWQQDRAPVYLAPASPRVRRLVALGSSPGCAPALRSAQARLPALARHVRALRVLLMAHEQDRALRGHRPAVARLAPAVVHGHDLAGGRAAAAIARLTGARCVYDIHELYPDMGGFPAWYRRIVRRQERAVVRRADAHFTVSTRIAAVIEQRYGRAPSLVLNVPDQPVVPPRPHSGPCRLLYHGGLIPGRNVLSFPSWIARAHERFGCTLTVLGFGPLRDALAEAIARAHAQTVCILRDPVPPATLMEFSSDYDIGLIPFEGDTLNNQLCLPNKLFEYLAAGLAIVSNAELLEVAERIRHDGLGVTFDARQPAGLTAALADMTPRDVLEPMRARSGRAAATTYSWKAAREVLTRTYAALAPLRT